MLTATPICNNTAAVNANLIILNLMLYSLIFEHDYDSEL
ncbi:conserved hypothetical protein [Vibrio rotiferianus]|nr:conserved hypothetical protein [Vibrio rotiferianus]